MKQCSQNENESGHNTQNNVLKEIPPFNPKDRVRQSPPNCFKKAATYSHDVREAGYSSSTKQYATPAHCSPQGCCVSQTCVSPPSVPHSCDCRHQSCQNTVNLGGQCYSSHHTMGRSHREVPEAHTGQHHCYYTCQSPPFPAVGPPFQLQYPYPPMYQGFAAMTPGSWPLPMNSPYQPHPFVMASNHRAYREPGTNQLPPTCAIHNVALAAYGCSDQCPGRLSPRYTTKDPNAPEEQRYHKHTKISTSLDGIENDQDKATGSDASKALCVQAAVTIQKHLRGFRDRQYVDKQVIPFFIQNRTLASSFVDQLMEEFLREEFIPDILIEVLTKADDPYQRFARDDVEMHDILGSITGEVVSSMVSCLVKEVINGIVNEYLFRSMENKVREPLMVVVDDTLELFLNDEVPAIIRECVRELVASYLELQMVELEFDQMQWELLDEVAIESLSEFELENDVALMSEEVLDAMYRECALEAINETELLYEKLKSSKDIVLMAQASESIIRETLLGMFISTVATKGESTSFRHEMNVFLKKQVIDMLLHLIRKHTSAQHKCISKAGFETAHKLFTSRAAADELLSRLPWVLQQHEQFVDEDDLDRLLGS